MQVLRSKRVALPQGLCEASVVIEAGRIVEVASYHHTLPTLPVEDFGDAFISPGVVDVHVHINEPGRTEWEGFETATKAAAAGGITTLIDMPLNSSPVTTTLAAWQEKVAASRDKLHVDCGFYGGLVPGNENEIEPLLDAGAFGIKAFLVHSGLDEFPAATEKELRAVMPLLAHRNVPLLVHAELDGGAPPFAGSRVYRDYLASRPPQWEMDATRLMIDLCREYGCPVHIVHLATAQALPMLREARAEGLPLSVETAPHYLFFEAEEIPDSATQFKCAPPIRGEANREGLWQGLREGIIDFIASDHSPCPPAMKDLKGGNFGKAWGGIASLQWTLSAVWTAARARGFGIEDVVRWTSERPASFLKLQQRFGVIEAGREANLAVWESETSFVINKANSHHRHKVTPYAGRELFGKVRATYLRGEKIYDGEFVGDLHTGRTVLPGL